MSWDGNIHGIIIGSKNYPLVNSGLLSNKYDKKLDSGFFLKNKTDFSSIVRARRSILNASSKVSIKSHRGFIEKIREAGLSYNPVRSELELSSYSGPFSKPNELLPHGPMVRLKNFRLTENFKVPGYVDKVVSDDLNASEGLSKLYKRGFDIDYMSQLFSTSNLGLKTERKLVPSRWSVTAVDDTLGLNIKKKLDFDSPSEVLFFKNSYLGNDLYIFLFSGAWEFEFIEYYGGEVIKDYESSFGRKNYAKNTTGGYYAAKLAVLEYLKRENISAKALVIRDIRDYYKFSLGVWVVREAVRKTLDSEVFKFNDIDNLEKEAKLFISNNLSLVVDHLFYNSKVLSSVKHQTTLGAFR